MEVIKGCESDFITKSMYQFEFKSNSQNDIICVVLILYYSKDC